MTDLKVVPLTNSPNGENVRERLEDALNFLEKESVSNCVIILVCKDGSVMDCWANGSNVYTVIGALEGVKMEFMNKVIEKR